MILLTRPVISAHISSRLRAISPRSSFGNPRRSVGYASGFLSPGRAELARIRATYELKSPAELVIRQDAVAD